MAMVVSPGFGCNAGACFGTGVLSVTGAGVGTGALVAFAGFFVTLAAGLGVVLSVGVGETDGVAVLSGDSEGASAGVGETEGTGVGVGVTSGGTKGVNVGFSVGVGLGVGVSYSYLAIARTCTLPELFGTASSIELIVRRSGPDVISV